MNFPGFASPQGTPPQQQEVAAAALESPLVIAMKRIRECDLLDEDKGKLRKLLRDHPAHAPVLAACTTGAELKDMLE